MNRVSFDEVADIFNDIWCDSKEHLFHEIAWDCLDKAGLTMYSDDKTYAQIYVYAYVIQMLCDEFSYMAYDEFCAYEYDAPEEDPLTDAAIGWLYRDSLDTREDAGQCFSMSANKMFCALIKDYRHKVADAIFDQLGETTMGAVLFFSIHGKRLAECDEDESNIQAFQSKEELLAYSREIGIDALDHLTDYNGMRVWNWLETHSCSIDD